MLDRRLHIDDWNINQRNQIPELRVGQIVFQIPPLREGADPDRIAIGGDHRHRLANVLGGRAVHHDTRPCLQSVDGHFRRDHERPAAQPRHGRLKRGQRAQRRAEKQQRQDLAFQGAGFGPALQAPGKLQQAGDFRSIEIRQIIKAFHYRVPPAPGQDARHAVFRE